MTYPLKPDILELSQLLIRAQEELKTLLSPEETEAFAEAIERFATVLRSPDPDDQIDAWLEARQVLMTFAAYRQIEGEKRKFFEKVDIPPQRAEEVIPQLIATAKTIRDNKKSKKEGKRT
jgi:hypothetical protein